MIPWGNALLIALGLSALFCTPIYSLSRADRLSLWMIGVAVLTIGLAMK